MAQVARTETEMQRDLDAFIDALPNRKNALIQVLHRAQDIYGYLPKEVQTHIARKLNVPTSRVFGVVTFYSFLKMEPSGKIPVSVCMGTACFVRGADAVLKELESQLHIKNGETSEDMLFTLTSIRCVGACGLAPVVTVGGQVYGRIGPDDVKGIIDEHMAKEGMDHVN